MISALALLAVALGPVTAVARTFTDALGVKTELSEHPARVVTLAPSLGELAADLLEDKLERVVGVSEYTDYPPVLAKRASVGPFYKFSLERVLSLKPDLVLSTSDGNPKDQVEQLRESKVPVITLSTDTLAGIERSIQMAGEALGESERGKRLAQQLHTGLERIRSRAGKGVKPRVLLQVGDDPLVAAGKGSFLDEAITLVGAENVYGDSAMKYPKPSTEDVIQRNPDVIVLLAMDKDLKPFQAMAKKWESFPRMKAVARKAVRVLQGDTILRPSLRLLEGLDLLERAIHGANR